jgi:hypothetical protein
MGPFPRFTVNLMVVMPLKRLVPAPRGFYLVTSPHTAPHQPATKVNEQTSQPVATRWSPGLSSGICLSHPIPRVSMRSLIEFLLPGNQLHRAFCLPG